MSPQFVMNTGDVERALHFASSLGNPLAIAARVAGLGEVEQRAGVPTWAWITVALGAGFVLGAVYGPEIEKRFY